jgi:hypothetical protein
MGAAVWALSPDAAALEVVPVWAVKTTVLPLAMVSEDGPTTKLMGFPELPVATVRAGALLVTLPPALLMVTE